MRNGVSIQERMLKVEVFNLQRQYCVLIAGLATTISFTVAALLQAGTLVGIGKQPLANLSLAFDFLGTCIGMLFLVSGLLLVFKVERDKRDIERDISKVARRAVKYRKPEKEAFIDRVSNTFERCGNKVDLLGSICTTSMQTTYFILLLCGIAVSRYTVGPWGFRVQDIVDIVGNSCFFLAILMFTASHVIMHRRKEAKLSASYRSQSRIFLLLCCANTLILFGKVLCVLESMNIIQYFPLDCGTLPVGMVTRIVGMVLFGIGISCVINETTQKCKELQQSVEQSALSSQCVVFSPHEVRSCFGYRGIVRA